MRVEKLQLARGPQRGDIQPAMRDEVTAIDAAKRSVRLASGADLAYERLVVSPSAGISTSSTWPRPQSPRGSIHTLGRAW